MLYKVKVVYNYIVLKLALLYNFVHYLKDMQKIRTQSISESANFCFLQRLSVISGFRRDCPRSHAFCRDYHQRKMASCRDCLCDSPSCGDSQQEAKSHGQSLQEAIYQAQVSAGSKRSCTVLAEAKYVRVSAGTKN